jgi:hypothetical protein
VSHVRRFGPLVAVAGLAVAAVVLVSLTLRQPSVVTFPATPPAPREVGSVLVGPVQYTVDATSADVWRYFSFGLGSVVDSATQWDLAFRRYQIIANGGPGYAGQGGVLDLGPVRFDEVRAVPATGYVPTETRGDPRNPAIASWYEYGFFSHVLQPKPRVWAVRTAAGRYAKLEILGYYCTGGQPGCLTFRYVYQGNGTPQLTPAPDGR